MTIHLHTKAERLLPGMQAFGFFCGLGRWGKFLKTVFAGAEQPMLDTLGHSGKGPGRSWVEWMGVAHSRNGGELSARAERLHPGMRAFRFLGRDSIFGNSFSGAGHPPVDDAWTFRERAGAILGRVDGGGPFPEWLGTVRQSGTPASWDAGVPLSCGWDGGVEPPLTPRKREGYNGPTFFCACYNDSGKG